MSDLKASVTVTSNGFEVSGLEQINYGETRISVLGSNDSTTSGFQFVDNIFDPAHDQLAKMYKAWNRVLLVTDATVNGIYSKKWEAYFEHHGIPLTTFIMAGGEKNKTMDTMLSIVDAMTDFGIVRKEPVLVVGGGYVQDLHRLTVLLPNHYCRLCTDVTGYACASYRRTTNFIRVPTTLIGLIDASVSIKGRCIW